ncbi:LytR/AlgR family response regulator transcription factor [Oceanithermus desulfurans]|uniref:DNA-binding LytR/AlgR family response regulator n=1 Tax=Oceanithermus desulfurans TaxID=227924 RepID=A0ABR6P4E9_9DEIN|nr:LytTR family DNA-binding domain-containing protein [Oceanithermus desulfurans]MBB6029293.1 DNA-binding LytR/AlgR family response regulator [Oceanithermus desulfurans]
MKVLIVDDERPARAELRWALEQSGPDLEVHEASEAAAALGLLHAGGFDAVFLDVNMPGLSGLQLAELLAELPRRPLVVFATAYAEHAARAFELEAADYLVKPYDEVRVGQTLERLRRRLAEAPAPDPAGPPRRLWVELENENLKPLELGAVAWFEAREKRVFAHAPGGPYRLRQTLKELEAWLPPEFVRVHKAAIVNLEHVAEVVPWFSGTYRIRLKDGATVRMSRRHAAGFWKAGGGR